MSTSGLFLDYRGSLDFGILNSLLIKLKKNKEFRILDTFTSRRVYSIVVESLENICKHSDQSALKKHKILPFVTVKNQNDKIIIKAGNPVTIEEKKNLEKRIDHINNSNESDLKKSYKDIMMSDHLGNDKCAGLGFIHMALISGNKILYTFSPIVNGYLYFEIKITLNTHIMRKLIIEPESNSPKVVLDADKKIYLIAGESRPPDVREFYDPIIEWLRDYDQLLQKLPEKQKEPFIFNFDFEYFNSSSGKSILDVCKVLTGMQLKGINVSVNWHFEKEDFDMHEAGKEISAIVKLPFKFVEEEQKQY